MAVTRPIGCVDRSGGEVFLLYRRVLLQDVFRREAIGKVVEDGQHRDARVAVIDGTARSDSLAGQAGPGPF